MIIKDGTGTITPSGNTWTSPSNSKSITWSLSNDLYTITTNNILVKSFELSFNKTNNENKIETWTDSGEQRAGVSAANSATSLTMDFHNQGLQVDGLLGLNINFGADNSNISTSKTIIVNNLSTLQGNLTIFGGETSNTFNIEIDSMTGNIDFAGGNIDDDNGTITITNSLIGNMIATADLGRKGTQSTGNSNGTASNNNNGTIINFTNGATMTGSILGRGNGYDSLKRKVTFNGANSNITVLTGNIISYGTNSVTNITLDKTAGNHVVFSNGNMLGSIIATTGNGMPSKKGYNNITFASADTQTLTGGILASDNNNQGNYLRQATNTLNIDHNTTLHIIATINGDGSASTTVSDSNAVHVGNAVTGASYTLTTGSIVAKDYGVNEINLAASSTLTLDGNISTENNAKSIITFTGTNGTINGNITTSGGNATISIANSASGAIVGSIIANGGQNIFSLGNTNQDNISTNTLTLTSITAESSNNYISNNTNASNFTSSWTSDTYKALGSLDIQTLTSTTGSNYLNISSIDHTNDENTIGTNVSASGSGANYIVADTLNFASLTAEQNGSNYIIANTSAQFGSITAGKIANNQDGGGGVFRKQLSLY